MRCQSEELLEPSFLRLRVTGRKPMMQKSGCSVVTAAVLFERRKRMRLWMPAVLVGFLIDCLLGDPAALPHPIVLIGKGIAALERALRRRFPATPEGERAAGRVLVVCMLLLSAVVPAANAAQVPP